jgi:hypothetical protein
MVAKITTPKSIEAALNYNEKKVQQGNALCLYAANFLNDANNMNFYQKLNAFERLNNLNERATTRTLHVSLNFDPSEKLSENKLVEIASLYMDKIGFGEQPFLIYKHTDAGHPHIHIVSTTIKDDGSRISTHNIGRNQSEKARKEIEELFGLVKADRQQTLIRPGIMPVDVKKAIYGKTETKRSIANVVGAVFNQYKFCSLPEFNAALKQFNVVADHGKENGRIFKNRGLVYRILDADGNKIGVPIKASSISCKPTLGNLEKKFINNESSKDVLKQRMKNTIDSWVQTSPGSMKNLIDSLSRQNIYTALRQNAEGRLYGITFVDNQNKVVFNGSDLGNGYSASGLQSKLGNTEPNILNQQLKKDDDSSGNLKNENHSQEHCQNQSQNDDLSSIKNKSIIEMLITPKEQYDNTTSLLMKKKKNKKKKKRYL